MYLHLGGDMLVRKKDVVGICDIETTSISKITRQFLSMAERQGHIINVSSDLPKAFVICHRNGATTVYLTQISSATLAKRIERLPAGVADSEI